MSNIKILLYKWGMRITFGKECHTICCALCGILFGVESFKGKDAPHQCGKPDHKDRGGKTVRSS